MATSNLLLLVMVLVIPTASTGALGGRSISQAGEYDELQLVLQWPITFCNTHYCDYNLLQQFTAPHLWQKFRVHGLWLNRNSCPVTCQTDPHNLLLQIEAALRREMEDYWPDLLNQQHPENFWLREYAKHGSCFADFYYQMPYFQKAQAFLKDIGDVMTTMQLSTGPLRMDYLYQVKDFEYATIHKGEHLRPKLRCMHPIGSQHPQLLEIVFCKNTYGKPKKCTGYDPLACTGWFTLPSYFQLRSPPRSWVNTPVPEFRTCPSTQVPAFLPSTSRYPPGTRSRTSP